MLEFDYHIIMDINHSVYDLQQRLARRLTKKIAARYLPKFRKDVSWRFQEIPHRPQDTDLIIEHLTTIEGTKRHLTEAVLEFNGPSTLGFYVPDSARIGLTREYICSLLDRMPDIVCKGM